MKQWEYKKVAITKLLEPHYQELSTEKLNEVGSEGWELVLISSGVAIFKKEKRVRTVREL